MAILQALLALITRSVGKILNAIFGWAVHALFGRTTPRDQTMLSAIVGAAVAWPLLVAGIAAPKVAAFALAFVPFSRSIPAWILRIVWLGLALAVPLALGLAIAARGKTPEPLIKRLLRGFPLTLGLAVAFLIMFISVPVMRAVTLVRRQKSADIPLATDAAAYHEVAGLVAGALRRHGFELLATEPGWWVKAPMRVLGWFGGSAFSGFVPTRLEHYQADGLDISFYTSGVLIRGKGQRLTLAHGLIEEAVVHSDGLQTSAPRAQELERRIRSVWKVFDGDPRAHAGSRLLLAQVADLGRTVAALDVPYDEWQVLYRQLLQLDRAVRGEGQLLDETGPSMDRRRTMSGHDEDKGTQRPPAALSTPELVAAVMHETGRLVKTQIELATNELRADIRAEAGAAKGLGVAAVASLVAFNLLLVTAVVALAQVMPAWVAGLAVSGAIGLVAIVAGVTGWARRVRTPLQRTRREIEKDIQWTKERMA